MTKTEKKKKNQDFDGRSILDANLVNCKVGGRSLEDALSDESGGGSPVATGLDWLEVAEGFATSSQGDPINTVLGWWGITMQQFLNLANGKYRGVKYTVNGTVHRVLLVSSYIHDDESVDMLLGVAGMASVGVQVELTYDANDEVVTSFYIDTNQPS